MKKIIILSLICIMIGSRAFSQTAPTIRTARPAKTIGVRVVGVGIFQHQIAINFSEIQSGDRYEFANGFRYGLSENLEVSAVANITEVNNSRDQSGLSNTQLGFRVGLFNTPDKFIKGAAFQFRVKLPWESSDFKSSGVSSSGTLSFSQNLYSKLGLRYNLGFNEQNRRLNYNYAVNLSRELVSKLNTFLEAYGDFSGSNDRLFFNMGASYLVSSNAQVDIAAGRGRNRGLYQNFISLGYSWRLMP